MSAAFYAEDLGIDSAMAAMVSGFMGLAAASPAIKSARPWCRHEKVRVYFEPWSQNSLSVHRFAEKWFFDAIDCDIHAIGYAYGATFKYTLAGLIKTSTKNFSGAKTKARLVELAEEFYEQKASWC